MNKDQFFDKHKFLNIQRAELERKYRILREQEEMQRLQSIAMAKNTGGAGQSGVVNGLPSNAIEFVIDAIYGQGFGVSDLFVSDTTTVTISWGDGEEATEQDGSSLSFSHTYIQRDQPYVCRLTFDDISLVTEIYVSNNSANVIEARGLQNLVNLTHLEIDNNSLTTLDVSGMTNLVDLDASDCNVPGGGPPSLTSVNLTGCTALEILFLDDSDFSGGIPDLSGLNNLVRLDLDGSSIEGSVDISGLPNLEQFDFNSNPDLTEIIISSSQPLGANGNELYAYDCALTQTAVDNILVALSESAIENGYVDLSGGTNSPPSAGTGDSALDVLQGKGWSWDVNARPPGYVGIAASTDFDIEGDFTIEMFVNMNNVNGFPRPYSFGVYPAANAISLESGQLYFWANNASLMSGSFSPTLGQWYHICVMASGSTAYMFVDGVQIASAAYSGSISSQSLPLTIGYGNEANSGFNGKMSNFRWTESAVYSTSGFSVPTSPLTDLAATVLLTFQGTDLTALLLDNSGNGHNATNSGATFSAEDPFSSAQGSLQMGS
jgi:hypothetical protein